MLIALAPEARRPPGAVFAAVLGSLSPDIDIVSVPLGWDIYLRVHEIGTHTVAGVVACALLTAVIVRVFRPSRFKLLAFAAGLGAASHILLDILCGARLRLGWPIVEGYATIPVVAMADPLLFAVLTFGVTAVLFATERTLVARRALMAVALLLIVKAFLLAQAFSAYRATAEAAGGTGQVVQATWGTLRRWDIFDRTPDGLRAWRATAGMPSAALMFSQPLSRETTMVTNSRSLTAVQNFLRVHDLVFPVIEATSAGGSRVVWSDIRYCWNPHSCQFWFGGEYDARGEPVQQIVRIGPFTQTRGVDW
jgi:membrane-bound metal-dependent hydrolase YbcI (DUF457 family)